MKSEEYDLWFDSRTGRYVWSLERPLIMEMLGLKPGEPLLDIGCRTGRLLQAVGNCRTVLTPESAHSCIHLEKFAGIEWMQA